MVRMLASNPWKCLELHLASQRSTAQKACSFLRQASHFYDAAERAGTAKPVLLYYAFLNLAKAIILHKRPAIDLSRAIHGIRESQGNVPQRFTLTSQRVALQPARPARPAILNEFCQALGYAKLATNREWGIRDLLSQIPAIHRPYCHTLSRAERLYVVSDPLFLHDHDDRDVWSVLRVKRPEFPSGEARRRMVGRKYFRFGTVESDDQHYSFESSCVSYGRSPLECLPALCAQLRMSGVVSILTPYGYRYYLSDFEPRLRVPPIVAAYMSVFYFGSVARYRPSDFEKMRSGKYGWVIEEMLSTQGEQFVYQAVSELLGSEVSRPWAVQRSLHTL